MLAESANRAGYSPLVIDRFGDGDTEQLAFDNWVVEQLTVECLQAVIDKLISQYSVEQLMVGSGFESHPDSLLWLASKFTLIGNSSDTVELINNPQDFTRRLQALKIAHPETRFQPPALNFQQWLHKPVASEGGVGVGFCQDQSTREDTYWQRYQSGPCYSALFVANGNEARLIGFNRQWVTEQHDQAFVFSGVINKQDHALQQHHETIQNWITVLTSEYALLGLNGIDFIVANDRCWLLEINPRPPASMVLYDREHNMLNLHISACTGHLPNNHLMQSSEITAYQIIYANDSLTIPNDFSWPEWVSDLPRSGTNIDTQQPICSIIAVANNADSVIQTLQHRTQTLYQLFNNQGAFSTCNIQPALINYPSL